MKYEEVRAKATPVPLEHNAHDIYPAGRPGIRIATVYGVAAETQVTAAMLAHCYNHFDELVAVVSALLCDQETLKPPWRNEALCEKARAILAAVEDVK